MEVSQIRRQGQSAIQRRFSSLQRRHQRLRRRHERATEALAIAKRQLQTAGETIRQREQTIACQQVQIEMHSQQRRHDEPGHFLDPAVYGHRYAASMVSLCVNLANVMPLRTIPKTLQIILSALGIETLVPDRETITRWCKRLGLDRLTFGKISVLSFSDRKNALPSQQSELAQLTPPSLKTKARFMNIEPIIGWGEMILAVLEDPRAPQSGVRDVDKLEQRMGWLREYRELIASWKRCCDVLGWSLWWINTHALQSDTAQQMRGWLEPQRVERCELSDRMLGLISDFLVSSSSGLRAGERVWISSAGVQRKFEQDSNEPT